VSFDLTPSIDWIGYLGSACVLSAFCMRHMLPLRLASIVGNVVFITYALGAGLMPVLLMNTLLLPLNLLRLKQALAERGNGGAVPASGVASRAEPVIKVSPGGRCFAPLV
jgi:hypothetical protein